MVTIKLPDVTEQHRKTPSWIRIKRQFTVPDEPEYTDEDGVLHPATTKVQVSYAKKLFIEGSGDDARVLRWHEVLDRIVEYVQDHTVEEMKALYTKVTGDDYEGVSTKKQITLGILRTWFPNIPDGTTAEILAWCQDKMIDKGEWGLGCPSCRRHWRFKPADNRAGWLPEDEEAYRLQTAEVLETVEAFTVPEYVDEEGVTHEEQSFPATYLVEVPWEPDSEPYWTEEVPQRRGYLDFRATSPTTWYFKCDQCGEIIVLEK